ncbi:hypothetical protein BGZ63DRAFT_216863 [Mariannaea sp. PMI_226]|nr:hypothetical protein BGZ63DRAFT_216863 [Mariannaea sp. PMI_226]
MCCHFFYYFFFLLEPSRPSPMEEILHHHLFLITQIYSSLAHGEYIVYLDDKWYIQCVDRSHVRLQWRPPPYTTTLVYATHGHSRHDIVLLYVSICAFNNNNNNNNNNDKQIMKSFDEVGHNALLHGVVRIITQILVLTQKRQHFTSAFWNLSQHPSVYLATSRSAHSESQAILSLSTFP